MYFWYSHYEIDLESVQIWGTKVPLFYRWFSSRWFDKLNHPSSIAKYDAQNGSTNFWLDESSLADLFFDGLSHPDHQFQQKSGKHALPLNFSDSPTGRHKIWFIKLWRYKYILSRDDMQNMKSTHDVTAHLIVTYSVIWPVNMTFVTSSLVTSIHKAPMFT